MGEMDERRAIADAKTEGELKMEKGFDFGDFLDPGNILFYIFLPITLPIYLIMLLIDLF